MRIIALVTALTLAAGGAVAAPAAIHVAIGPKLQVKAHKDYGDAEVARLAEELRKDVARELDRTGVHDGARVELVLEDALPNRPTFKQMSDRPGLSMASFGLGGAAVRGQIVDADGKVTPVAYRYYAADIRDAARASWTWTDAEWTFDRFARRLGRGQSLAER